MTKQTQPTEPTYPSKRTKFYKVIEGIFNGYPTETMATYETTGLTTFYTKLELSSYKVLPNGDKMNGWNITALHEGDIEVDINQSLDGKRVVIQKHVHGLSQPLLLSLPITGTKVRRGLSSKPSYYLEDETLATIKAFIESSDTTL